MLESFSVVHGPASSLMPLTRLLLSLSCQNLGSVAVGDTFVWPPGPDGLACNDLQPEPESAASVPLSTGNHGLLTGGACAPYFFACSAAGGGEETEFRAKSKVRRFSFPAFEAARASLLDGGIALGAVEFAHLAGGL